MNTKTFEHTTVATSHPSLVQCLQNAEYFSHSLFFDAGGCHTSRQPRHFPEAGVFELPLFLWEPKVTLPGQKTQPFLCVGLVAIWVTPKVRR